MARERQATTSHERTGKSLPKPKREPNPKHFGKEEWRAKVEQIKDPKARATGKKQNNNESSLFFGKIDQKTKINIFLVKV